MRKLIWMLAALLTLAPAAFAQTAQEMTDRCAFSSVGKKTLGRMTDGDYRTYWASSSNGSAYVEIEAEDAIGGVYVQFYDDAAALDVQTRDASGAWQTVAQTDGAFLAAYAAVDAGAKTVRIRPKDGKGRLFIAELRVLGEGDAPGWVQQWQAPLEKADLLALAAHPDDEILFLGGTIPYYAGEMGKAVQVAYLVPTMPYRRLELLDGLWLCGVRNYPILGHFPDQFQLTLKGMYAQKGWSRESVYRFVTEVYRACRPDVVVTQDVNGEYGHGAHRAAADAAQAAVALAADASYQKKMAHSEPWQIEKLYIHLYEQNPVKMDWRKPLAAFEGQTAFDVACRAFACHVSQQKTDYHVEDFGPYDNSRFGLAFSAIGEDTRKDDFFEHVE